MGCAGGFEELLSKVRFEELQLCEFLPMQNTAQENLTVKRGSIYPYHLSWCQRVHVYVPVEDLAFIMAWLVCNKCLLYLDNILMIWKTFENHVSNLREVFD